MIINEGYSVIMIDLLPNLLRNLYWLASTSPSGQLVCYFQNPGY